MQVCHDLRSNGLIQEKEKKVTGGSGRSNDQFQRVSDHMFISRFIDGENCLKVTITAATGGVPYLPSVRINKV